MPGTVPQGQGPVLPPMESTVGKQVEGNSSGSGGSRVTERSFNKEEGTQGRELLSRIWRREVALVGGPEKSCVTTRRRVDMPPHKSTGF